MRTLYLVRHGMPAFPGEKKQCIGWTDLPLSPEGRRQMEALGEDFAGRGIQRIYTSPLSRCVESAHILSGGRIPVEILEELREIGMGEWEGLTFEEIRSRYPAAYRERGLDMARFCPPGGESFVSCQQRALRALEKIRAEENGPVVVLAHAGINRALISWKENRPLENLLQIPQGYGSVYTWEDPVFAGLIVAAGFSSRMGSFKPLMELDGQKVIEREIATLRQGGVGEIAVVTGYRAEELREVAGGRGMTFLHNGRYAETRMFDSVRMGLRYFAEKKRTPAGEALDGIYFLPVDVPLFSLFTMEWEARAFAAGGGEVYCPWYEGAPGHPLLIRCSALEELLAHNGERGLKGAYERLGERTVRLDMPDAGCVMDADTPEEFARLEAFAQSRQVPDEAACRRLLAWFGTPEESVRHSEAVAQLAVEMGRACLSGSVHPSGDADAGGLNLALVYAGGLLHDLAKGQPDHARAGGRWLRLLGYGPAARIVEEHTDLPPSRQNHLNESLLVYLADKRIRGTRRVSLEERFLPGRQRFAGDPEALAALERRFACAKKLEEWIRRKGYEG